MKSAGYKWRQFKSTLTSKFILPHMDDPEALKEPPEMYEEIIELSDWEPFVKSRLTEEWKISFNLRLDNL